MEIIVKYLDPFLAKLNVDPNLWLVQTFVINNNEATTLIGANATYFAYVDINVASEKDQTLLRTAINLSLHYARVLLEVTFN